ncbi:unnamed protein product [Paramecium octaurelia]|uniref:Uncharacterized protein n=1 Tax=Paramecium octaurelia TaxID=43137 RepID=A0A8S1Y3J1_PAROT|nr:unnamed protein product [Paramecium octaurelia]
MNSHFLLFITLPFLAQSNDLSFFTSAPLQNLNGVLYTEGLNFLQYKGWNYGCTFPFAQFPSDYMFFGLDCFYGSLTVDGAYIMIYDLPPHHTIKITFKYKSQLMLQSSSNEQESYLFADGKIVFQYRIILFSETNHIQLNFGAFSTQFSHSAETLLLEYLHLGGKIALSTSGFREFTVDLLQCPSGCQTCELNNLAICNSWLMVDFQMKAKELQNFNNDGWKPLGEKPANIIKCGSQTQFYFFGFFDKTTTLEKTVFLEPHYAIQVQFLIIYINFNRDTKPITSVLLDDATVYEVVELLDVLKMRMCNFIPIEQTTQLRGDQAIRVKVQNAHNQPNLKITLSQQQGSDINTPWGIRDFKILLKKCHSSCLESCSGPLESDCYSTTKVMTQLISFFTDPLLNLLDGWNEVSVYTDNKICNGQQIIGGLQDISLQKLQYPIFDLPKHSQLTISLTFYQIDSFQNNEKFYIEVDDVKDFEQQLLYITDYSVGTKLCGNSQQLDTSFQIKVNSIAHTFDNAIIKFYVLGTTTVGRWGIRELQIQADKKVFTKSFVKDDKSMVFWYSFTDALQIMDCQNQNFKLVYIQRDKILRKQLTSIPNHQRILVSFEVVVIYQFKFNNSRYLYLNIDGQNVWKQNFILTSEISLCDSTNRSQKFFFEAWLDHSSSTAILEFQADGSGLLEPAIYFGLRNINIQYEKILVS